MTEGQAQPNVQSHFEVVYGSVGWVRVLSAKSRATGDDESRVAFLVGTLLSEEFEIINGIVTPTQAYLRRCPTAHPDLLIHLPHWNAQLPCSLRYVQQPEFAASFLCRDNHVFLQNNVATV
jgi:hypothetical protein